jgi:hypothetical protein
VTTHKCVGCNSTANCLGGGVCDPASKSCVACLRRPLRLRPLQLFWLLPRLRQRHGVRRRRQALPQRLLRQVRLQHGVRGAEAVLRAQWLDVAVRRVYLRQPVFDADAVLPARELLTVQLRDQQRLQQSIGLRHDDAHLQDPLANAPRAGSRRRSR